ncbi:DEAD/DEAH box helicase [Candidatus Woesearchaeota archaeon]|nr:DEAD/DEAH box helicase [Candidatus Woesearchaeota archaeon]
MEEFKKLGLSNKTIMALEQKGFTTPTSIQAKVIPLLLEGKKDVVGQSQTGTGKTASFALPILEKIKERSSTVQAIVLTPTRELAIQVAQEIDSLKGFKNIKVLSVYGGSPIGPQRQKLREGVDIVVGTPGRVMDLQKRKSLRLNHVQYAVLDEADEMLNMGFVEDIENILQHTPKEKSMLLFSATMPKAILKIAEKYMREYEFIEVEKTDLITKTVEQVYYNINAKDRIEGLKRIIDSNVDFHGIIFCNTKANVDTLSQQLIKLEYGAAALHGDITQGQREKILQQFRTRSIKVLVATDVAARGIDVNDLTHVINFSLPQSPELYVHRIGRTGRAGKKGIAITFVIPSERRKLSFVERINRCKLEKREFPSAKEIVENKEDRIKTLIETIINANKGKSSKYLPFAKDLLKEHSPAEVVSAILKYGLKNELDINNYKTISEPTRTRSRSSSDRPSFNRGRRRPPNSRSDNSRFKHRSDERGSERKANPHKKSNKKEKWYEKKSSFRNNKRKKD